VQKVAWVVWWENDQQNATLRPREGMSTASLPQNWIFADFQKKNGSKRLNRRWDEAISILVGDTKSHFRDVRPGKPSFPKNTVPKLSRSHSHSFHSLFDYKGLIITSVFGLFS
jgi:hypothetical protein